MSNIIGDNNTESLLETTSASGGFQVIAQQEEENIIEIKGDGEVAIVGGSLKDEVTTGAGDAVIFAGGGDDVVNSGNGNDVIRGGVGDDVLFSGLGADVVIGGAGNDVIRGGLPATDADGNFIALLNENGEMAAGDEPKFGDLLKGGSGDDIFQFSADEFQNGVIDKIVDFKEDDFADTIKIFGVGVDGEVSYDDETGIVSVNGNAAIDIGAGKEVKFDVNEENGTWDLF